MSDETTGPAGSVRDVPARRISTGETSSSPCDETISVVVEAPLTIDVRGVGSYTLLCTPDDNLALATGFLLSEGIVESLNDVEILRDCADDPSVVRVLLTGDSPRKDSGGRNLLIVSSCGLCGVEGLDEKLEGLPNVADSLRLEARVLRHVRDELRGRQPMFQACGGTHATAIFDSEGTILATAEDAGRHNALDKAIGRLLRAGGSPAGCGAALSGRVSLEMVGKCAQAGIELISAISAPTSLAIEVAERCGVTLCAFVRETRATVFTHPGRLV